MSPVPSRSPARTHAARTRTQRRQRFGRRDRDSLPYLPRPEVAQHRTAAADVIRVTVGDRQAVEAPHPERPHRGHHHLPADVRPTAHLPRRVHQQRAAVRKAHQRGVGLIDVEEVHPERPRLTGRGRQQGAGVRGAPPGPARDRGGQHRRRTHRNQSRSDGPCQAAVSDEPDDPAGVVGAGREDPGRWEPPRQPGRPGQNQGRVDDAGRGDVRHPARRLRRGHADRRQTDRRHARQLGERHQWNRGEVEAQTGHGDAREMQRADRKQRKLGADRGHKQTGGGNQQEADRRRLHRIPAGPCHQARYPDQKTGRGAEGELEAGIDERSRVRRHQTARRQGQGIQGISPMVDRARREEHDGGEHRPRHRGFGCHDLRIAEETENRQQRREPPARTGDAQQQQQSRGQHRDVPAGDGDDVVDPRPAAAAR